MISYARAPFRVSFFGGGTDYPPYYLIHGGSVISTTINKYLHIFIKPTTFMSRAKFIIKYSRVEYAESVDEIEHPAVREVLKYLNITNGLELNIMSDIPAGSGLGSSSVFTVALIGALSNMLNLGFENQEIARLAIHVEQNLMNEKVGSQDQYAAAVGGLNHFKFNSDGNIYNTPFFLPKLVRDEFFSNFYLVYTSMSRKNATVTIEQHEKMKTGELDSCLADIKIVTARAKSRLLQRDIDGFGELLNKTWELKKKFASNITNSVIDDMYAMGVQNGASGGKLLGAGNGGFMLFYVPSINRDKFLQKCKQENLKVLKIAPDYNGLQMKFL